MLNKILAIIGIGSAKVELEVANSNVEIGSFLEGTIYIKGGNLEQIVEQIHIRLILNSTYGSGDETRHITRTLETAKVADQITLHPGQQLSIPIKFPIPINLPISRGRTRYHLLTILDIEQAIDPTDRDEITVIPNPYLKMLFDAANILGFVEKHDSGDFNGRYQEFEYRPTSFMAGKLDEIELYPTAGEQELTVAMQLDKRNRGLFGSFLDELDLDERYVHFRLPYSEMTDSAQVADILRDIIQREYHKI